MSDDESRAQRVNNVLVVRVQHEAINNLTYVEVSIGRLRRAAASLTLEADDGLELEVLFDDLFHWRYLDSIIIAGGEGDDVQIVLNNDDAVTGVDEPVQHVD